jgi:hypothetical protein
VKIGKSSSKTLALLTVVYVECTMKKWNVFEWHKRFKEGRKTTQELDSQKRKGRMQIWTEYEPWCAQIEG